MLPAFGKKKEEAKGKRKKRKKRPVRLIPTKNPARSLAQWCPRKDPKNKKKKKRKKRTQSLSPPLPSLLTQQSIIIINAIKQAQHDIQHGPSQFQSRFRITIFSPKHSLIPRECRFYSSYCCRVRRVRVSPEYVIEEMEVSRMWMFIMMLMMIVMMIVFWNGGGGGVGARWRKTDRFW